MRASAALWKERARQAGFNLVGITPAEASPRLGAYLSWLAAEMHGSMSYLAREDRVRRRQDLSVILPGVRSLVVVGLDYAKAMRGQIPTAELRNPARGRIAAYAWGADYHDVMEERLKAFAHSLTGIAPRRRSEDWKVYVDTGALLERSHGQRAGMGFVGKNTMLIHPRRGGNFFLGVLLTTMTFDEYDAPAAETMCGSCQRCLQACPTDAFPAPYVLDSRRCISYLTIEYKGWVARELRPKMGNWIFGCDICQEVCPFQRFAPDECEPVFCAADIERAAPQLLALFTLTEAKFAARYRQTALWRIGLPRLLRNACIAAGNWGDEAAIAPLERLLRHETAIVRGHAAWGLWRILGSVAWPILRQYERGETDEGAREEVRALLG